MSWPYSARTTCSPSLDKTPGHHGQHGRWLKAPQPAKTRGRLLQPPPVRRAFAAFSLRLLMLQSSGGHDLNINTVATSPESIGGSPTSIPRPALARPTELSIHCILPYTVSPTHISELAHVQATGEGSPLPRKTVTRPPRIRTADGNRTSQVLKLVYSHLVPTIWERFSHTTVTDLGISALKLDGT